jgi:hypothetical protein
VLAYLQSPSCLTSCWRARASHLPSKIRSLTDTKVTWQSSKAFHQQPLLKKVSTAWKQWILTLLRSLLKVMQEKQMEMIVQMEKWMAEIKKILDRLTQLCQQEKEEGN